MATAVVKSLVGSDPLQPYIPTKAEIANAKADLFDFLLSENAKEQIHNMWDFKDMLVKVHDTHINPKAAFDEVTGEFFKDLIVNATETGDLDPSVGKVYFADIDKVEFVRSLVQDYIFYVARHERVYGSPVPPTDEKIAQIRAEILELIEVNEEALAQLKNGITARAAESFEDAFIWEHEDHPSYCSLFEHFIKNQVAEGYLSKQVAEVYFAPRFNQVEFVRSLVEEILKD
jgi:hypothetical protein